MEEISIRAGGDSDHLVGNQMVVENPFAAMCVDGKKYKPGDGDRKEKQ